MADTKLFDHNTKSVPLSSHLLPPEKHHLGLRPRGHSYALPICPNNLCIRCFIPRCVFCLIGDQCLLCLNRSTCASVTCLLIEFRWDEVVHTNVP